MHYSTYPVRLWQGPFESHTLKHQQASCVRLCPNLLLVQHSRVGFCAAYQSQLLRVGVGAWIGRDAARGKGAAARGSTEEPVRAGRVVKVAQGQAALDIPSNCS